MRSNQLLVLPVALALSGVAQVGSAKAPEELLDEIVAKSKNSAYLTQSPQNRILMPDNPAYDTVDEGAKLFKQKRGPKNVSLEGCDFGKGPGVVKGAYVELPRYFADAGKVMDFESRLVYCMKTLQGFTNDDPQIKTRHGAKSDIMKISVYVAAQSNGMAWNPPMSHPMEKAMRDAGEVLFYRRSGTMDFGCITCHSRTGARIRAAVLPNNKEPLEWTKAVSWPAYRTSHEVERSSQHRVLECLWQMRYPNIKPDSDVNIAFISFWTDAARGQPAILPDMKR